MLSVSSKTELFEGENLITPFSNELSDWDVYKKEEGNFNARMWQKPSKGMADSFTVAITYWDKSGTKKKRQEVDKPGKEKCDKFESMFVCDTRTEKSPCLDMKKVADLK
jgi:hypothetical protein